MADIEHSQIFKDLIAKGFRFVPLLPEQIAMIATSLARTVSDDEHFLEQTYAYFDREVPPEAYDRVARKRRLASRLNKLANKIAGPLKKESNP